MSVVITSDVFCDRCGTCIHGVVGPRQNGTGARNVAIRAGWLIRLREDLCPKCKKEESHEKM